MLRNEAKTRRYLPIESEISIDGQTAASYGIGAIENDLIVDIVQDVSLDLQFVFRLTEICNAGQLSPCHLHDIVEDALN